MYYSMPSRRKKQRPAKLPLKVKLTETSDWSFVKVDQEVYPFLILFPFLNLPDELSGKRTEGERGAKVKTLWIRGASFRHGPTQHIQELAVKLGVAQIEPQATFNAPPFFQMLAKIAHAFAAAELGIDGFEPFLVPMILQEELSNSVQYIGGNPKNQPAGRDLHELALLAALDGVRTTLAVRIRLLSLLETPTYLVAVGRRSR